MAGDAWETPVLPGIPGGVRPGQVGNPSPNQAPSRSARRGDGNYPGSYLDLQSA